MIFHLKPVHEDEMERWIAIGWRDTGVRDVVPSISVLVALLEYEGAGSPPVPTPENVS